MRHPGAVLLILAACFAAGCGSKAKSHSGHVQSTPSPQTAPPTPDTTPIEALRTPAGLVLKTNETPAAGTPSPSPQPAATPARPAS